MRFAAFPGVPLSRATSRHIHRRDCRDDDAEVVVGEVRDVPHTPRTGRNHLRTFAQIGPRAPLQAVRELNAHARAVASRRAVRVADRDGRRDGWRRRGGRAAAVAAHSKEIEMYN